MLILKKTHTQYLFGLFIFSNPNYLSYATLLAMMLKKVKKCVLECFGDSIFCRHFVPTFGNSVIQSIFIKKIQFIPGFINTFYTKTCIGFFSQFIFVDFENFGDFLWFGWTIKFTGKAKSYCWPKSLLGARRWWGRE